MTVAVITRLLGMGRWEPDAQGRMIDAAIELFAERGSEQPTAGDLAEPHRATERTSSPHVTRQRPAPCPGSPASLHPARTPTADPPRVPARTAGQGATTAPLSGAVVVGPQVALSQAATPELERVFLPRALASRRD